MAKTATKKPTATTKKEVATKKPTKQATTKKEVVKNKKTIRGFKPVQFNWEHIFNDETKELTIVNKDDKSFHKYLEANKAVDKYAYIQKLVKHYNAETLDSAIEHAKGVMKKDKEISGEEVQIVVTNNSTSGVHTYEVGYGINLEWVEEKIVNEKITKTSSNPFHNTNTPNISWE